MVEAIRVKAPGFERSAADGMEGRGGVEGIFYSGITCSGHNLPILLHFSLQLFVNKF